MDNPHEFAKLMAHLGMRVIVFDRVDGQGMVYDQKTQEDLQKDHDEKDDHQ